jgi:DNA-directed RNA polymerase specialized sigma24 family protein
VRDRTPEAAFDALYLHSAPALLRQVQLLTGAPGFARRCVRHAFDQAWQHWPEVARDNDPVGWVRAAAYEYALAPWQRWVPGHGPRPRTPEEPLAAALLGLPPAHRRAVLLYDGLGLDLPEAAAEIEASTVSAAGRITRAREALAAAVPELADEMPARLGALLHTDDDPEPPDRPAGVRGAGERAARRRTVGAFALTGLIAVLATVTIALDPAYDRAPAPNAVLPRTSQASAPAAGHHDDAGPPPVRERTRAAHP